MAEETCRGEPRIGSRLVFDPKGLLLFPCPRHGHKDMQDFRSEILHDPYFSLQARPLSRGLLPSSH
jgi:hypothetical protein